MGWCKLHDAIVRSSVWSESYATRIVWVTILAIKDADGIVDASVPGLARAANVSREEAEEALRIFLDPDPDDRSGVADGRRLVVEPGRGWRVVNHKLYRDGQGSDERRERASRAGKRSAEVRRNRFGTAQPSPNKSATKTAKNKECPEQPEPYTDQIRSDQIRPDPTCSVVSELPARAREETRTDAAQHSSPSSVATLAPAELSSPPAPLTSGSENGSEGQIRARAQALTRDPYSAPWDDPRGWPEVQRVAEHFAEATSSLPRRLGDLSRDRGLQAIVGLLADGWGVEELCAGIDSAVRSEWWSQGRRGLASLTPEVMARAVSEAKPAGSRRKLRLGEVESSSPLRRGKPPTPEELELIRQQLSGSK